MGGLGCLQKVVLFSMFLFGLLTMFRKMTWRCSLTPSIRPSALIFVGFSQYIPFLAPGFIMGGPGIFVGKCLKMSKKKGSIWFPYLAQGIEWRLLWGGQIFPRATSCALFFVKNALWNAYFLLEQVDQFLSRLRAICARTLERSKTVFPNLYSFSKKCHKNENAVFKTAKWTRILMHPKLMHSNFEFFWCTRSKMSVCT